MLTCCLVVVSVIFTYLIVSKMYFAAGMVSALIVFFMYHINKQILDNEDPESNTNIKKLAYLYAIVRDYLPNKDMRKFSLKLISELVSATCKGVGRYDKWLDALKEANDKFSVDNINKSIKED